METSNTRPERLHSSSAASQCQHCARFDACCSCQAKLHSPLAESFLVLIIFAAYSWPVDFLTHRRTTEKAPLNKNTMWWVRAFFLDCVRVLSLSYSRDVHQLQRKGTEVTRIFHADIFWVLDVRKGPGSSWLGGGRQSRTDRVSSRWLRLSRTPPRQRQPHREIKPYKVAL